MRCALPSLLPGCTEARWPTGEKEAYPPQLETRSHVLLKMFLHEKRS